MWFHQYTVVVTDMIILIWLSVVTKNTLVLWLKLLKSSDLNISMRAVVKPRFHWWLKYQKINVWLKNVDLGWSVWKKRCAFAFDQLICRRDKPDLLPSCVAPWDLPFAADTHQLSHHLDPCCQIKQQILLIHKKRNQESHTLSFVCLLWPRKPPPAHPFSCLLPFDSHHNRSSLVYDGHALFPIFPCSLFWFIHHRYHCSFPPGFQVHLNSNQCPSAGARGDCKSLNTGRYRLASSQPKLNDIWRYQYLTLTQIPGNI